MLRSTPVSAAAALLLVLGALGSCNGDPQREKQRYLESGQRYFLDGKYAEATIQFRKALQIDPHSVETYRRLGQAYYELQRWPEAAEALSLAVETDPQDLEARLLLGEVYLNTRDYQNV